MTGQINKQDLNVLVKDVSSDIQNKNMRATKVALTLPPITPVVLTLILFVVLIFNYERYVNPHEIPIASVLSSGEQFALKAIAEDVETYRMVYGQLPDELPNSSAISAIVDVEYEKLDEKNYKLYMKTDNGEYTLNQEGTIKTVIRD
jgi:hypothetical protein